MDELYAEVAARIVEHAPTCWNKGECCRFGEFGHRLYVTTLEVAYYLANQAGSSVVSIQDPRSLSLLETETCPHAHDGKCHARDGRPLGCRVFYCDPQARDWQGPLTETYLQRLRALHEELGVTYFYADWLAVLRALRGEVTSECDE